MASSTVATIPQTESSIDELREAVARLSSGLGEVKERLVNLETELHSRQRSHVLPQGRLVNKTYSYGGELPPKELLDGKKVQAGN